MRSTGTLAPSRVGNDGTVRGWDGSTAGGSRTRISEPYLAWNKCSQRVARAIGLTPDGGPEHVTVAPEIVDSYGIVFS
jgi:hypothetical protein